MQGLRFWEGATSGGLTVGGLAHLKAVERGPIHFASGTYMARRSLFSSSLHPKNIIECGCSRSFHPSVGSDHKSCA
jgi:hypothetical protein